MFLVTPWCLLDLQWLIGLKFQHYREVVLFFESWQSFFDYFGPFYFENFVGPTLLLPDCLSQKVRRMGAGLPAHILATPLHYYEVCFVTCDSSSKKKNQILKKTLSPYTLFSKLRFFFIWYFEFDYGVSAK